MRRRRLKATAPSPKNKRTIEHVTDFCVPWVRLGLQGFAPLRRRGAANIPDGPVLVLSNHVSLLDPCCTITAGARPIHWLATAAAMQQPGMGRVLQVWGSVPKKKFTVDTGSIRALKKWLDLGAKVGSYPEGERSWDGRLLPLLPGIEALVRLLKVPVMPVRVHNASRVLPRWAEVRRYGPITIEFGQPRAFERRAPPAEIRAWLEAQLALDLDEERTRGPVRSRGSLALGIDNPLFRCPQCLAWDALIPSGDEVRCSACRSTWRVDTRNCMIARHGPARSMTIVEAREAVDAGNRQSFVVDEQRFGRDGTIAISEVARILEVSGDVARPIGSGRMVLDLDGVRVVDASARTILDMPFDDIVTAAVELRRRLTFRTKDEGLYEVVLPRESPLKWSVLVEHWRKAPRESVAI